MKIKNIEKLKESIEKKEIFVPIECDSDIELTGYISVDLFKDEPTHLVEIIFNGYPSFAEIKGDELTVLED